MPPWKLHISQSVLKDLRDLPKEIRASAALSILELAATRTGNEVAIIAVRHRKDVYRELK